MMKEFGLVISSLLVLVCILFFSIKLAGSDWDANPIRSFLGVLSFLASPITTFFVMRWLVRNGFLGIIEQRTKGADNPGQENAPIVQPLHKGFPVAIDSGAKVFQGARREINSNTLIAEGAMNAKVALRDGDSQAEPYTYSIGRHANETLAMRYGIANIRRRKSSDGDDNFQSGVGELEERTIVVKKTAKARDNVYLAVLPRWRDRKVKVVIEPGTEYVKTFLPLDEEAWFNKYEKYEEALKGNSNWTLTQLAKFYIDKVAVSANRVGAGA